MNMMKVQKWFDEVLINPLLNEEQQEEKIIQLTDLLRFIESYKPSMEILDYSKSINIVKDDYLRKGIVFYDYKLLQNPLSFSSYFTQSYLEILKIQNNLNELWFVFVNDNLNSDNQKIVEFVKENEVKDLYDEVFFFDFFESQTQKFS